MAIRIQLSSNYQVLELTYPDFNSIKDYELDEAIELINDLGSKVVADIKTQKGAKSQRLSSKPQKNTTRTKASQKQIDYAISLGLDEDEAVSMSKEEIWAYIQKNK